MPKPDDAVSASHLPQAPKARLCSSPSNLRHQPGRTCRNQRPEDQEEEQEEEQEQEQEQQEEEQEENVVKVVVEEKIEEEVEGAGQGRVME